MKRNKILLMIVILLLVLSPLLFTFSKYVLQKSGVYSVNLKGVKFDDSNLVVSDQVDYNDTTNTLVNPERGFLIPYEATLASSYTNDAKATLLTATDNVKIALKNNGYTLSRAVIYLTNYKDSDIPIEWLSALDEVCGSFRNDGYKLIVRFAYDTTENSDPTNFNQILRHMDQLSSFFSKNSDVIFAVELGFIGPWGESHSSTYATKEYRNQIMEKALEVVPESIQLLVRTPTYYEDYFGEGYFDHKIGYTSNNAARVGIYNDGYLASETDLGTYQSTDREKELKWMSYLTKYTIFGGETVYVDDTQGYFDSASSIYNMSKTHTNYLNSVYHPTAIEIWNNSTISSDINSTYNGVSTYKYISDKLGYRFLVNEVKLPGYEVSQGGYLNFSFSIDNVGFGNLINYRNVQVILEQDGKYYRATTEIDPRYWFSGEDTNEEVVMKLPSNIKTGNWNIYLCLPDRNSTLWNNSNYYVKFANNNIWLDELNANYIGNITVKEDSSSTSDNGFYQVNTISDLSDNESEVYSVTRNVYIDGVVTGRFEWIEEDIVYDSDGHKLYLRSDGEYLYLYTESGNVVPSDSLINIYFATTAVETIDNYNYAIQNDLIYPYSAASGFGTAIGGVLNAKDDGFEYKVALSTLNISSLDELRGIKVEFLNTDWSKQSDYVAVIGDSGMFVDGAITHDREYQSDNIFYTDDTATIYTKIDNDYLYVYASNSDLVGQDMANPSLYIGSNDTTKTSTEDGYMLWYETSLIPCDNTGCSSSNALSGYVHKRAVGDGTVEFKIPTSVIGIDEVSDIRNLKILYRNSSWSEIKVTEVIYKIKLADISGKTAVIAKKPSSWSKIYIYVYGDDTISDEWPGVKMTPFDDGSGIDKYVYVLPDNFTGANVIFNDTNGLQSPSLGYDIFRIDTSQVKYWNGVVEDSNVNNWSNYDGSVSDDKNINFKFKLPDGTSTSNGVCVHIYDDNSNKTGDWPGMSLTYNDSTGYWEGIFAATDTYNNLRVILNNCNNGYQVPSSTGVLIKPGTTVGYWDGTWRVLQDKN